jgi:hypothetical protein
MNLMDYLFVNLYNWFKEKAIYNRNIDLLKNTIYLLMIGIFIVVNKMNPTSLRKIVFIPTLLTENPVLRTDLYH